MKIPIKLLALVAALALAAFAVETTLSSLPSNTFAAPATTMDQAHVDSVNAIVSAQNANNTSLRASITGITSGPQTFTGASTATAWNLVNPVITGPAPVSCGATCSPTAGQLIVFATASGSTATLPAASGTGNVIRIRITVATTSAAEKVLLTTVTDVILGTAVGENGSTAIVFVGNAGTYHSLQMPFAGSQPSGGFIGDSITCTDIAAAKWACDVQYQGGTTPTTPYSTSTT